MSEKSNHVFVCISQYQRPLAEVDEHLAAHIGWLKEQDAAGRIIATGRQVSGTGGVNIMAARDREEMQRILATDPFSVHRCSSYWIFEFELNPQPDTGRLMSQFLGDGFAAGSS